MRPRVMVIAAALLLTAVLVVWIVRQPQPTPPPVNTPAPTPSATREQDLPEGGSTYVNEGYGLALTMPPGWSVFDLSEDELARALDTLQSRSQGQAYQTALAQFAGAGASVEAVGMCCQGVAEPRATMSLLVTPANGLTQDAYLRATGQTMQELGASVELTQLESNLRPEGVPVASMAYATGDGQRGYQAAFFDLEGVNMVVLTFSAAQDDYADLLPSFQEIVRRITLGAPTE